MLSLFFDPSNPNYLFDYHIHSDSLRQIQQKNCIFLGINSRFFNDIGHVILLSNN